MGKKWTEKGIGWNSDFLGREWYNVLRRSASRSSISEWKLVTRDIMNCAEAQAGHQFPSGNW
jgi:hypothetical protein